MRKIVGLIPAHLASVRFPRKILFPFSGLPMIEHVRRRALMSQYLNGVYVTTCDEEIADAVKKHGGNVIMTGDHHKNGTNRIAEAVQSIDCSHVVLLQGDEPLLLPRHVDTLANSMMSSKSDAWNATGEISNMDELDRDSFVKCAVNADDRILYCFRRSPSHQNFDKQQKYIRKILGLFSFQKEYLLNLTALPPAVVETFESIEQMRIIENGDQLVSVPMDVSLPSVNEPHEADIVLKNLQGSAEQRNLLERVLNQ